ncbi:PolC-type DNA polymerase III [Shewanella waksmanii]|uniref:3'-5' exonuclease n=1 Tax=Shewanella waksmanii TaxID=213783 RepID=UPI0037364AFF
MTKQQLADTVIVFDFETTGLSPAQGDRAIEIGAVLIENGQIQDRFQALMNPGFAVSPFIADYTGINNQMLSTAEPCGDVMARFADFIAGHNLVAHNASFDWRFLEYELAAIGRVPSNAISCSMLISRRLLQHAPSHSLGSLVSYLNLPNDGVFHRALYDAEMTASLWLALLDELAQQFQVTEVDFALMQKIAKTPKAKLTKLLLNT